MSRPQESGPPTGGLQKALFVLNMHWWRDRSDDTRDRHVRALREECRQTIKRTQYAADGDVASQEHRLLREVRYLFSDPVWRDPDRRERVFQTLLDDCRQLEEALGHSMTEEYRS